MIFFYIICYAVDLNQEKVVGEILGLDVGSDGVVSDGKELFVSYAGFPIWKYDLSAVRGNVLPTPEMIWNFPRFFRVFSPAGGNF